MEDRQFPKHFSVTSADKTPLSLSDRGDVRHCRSELVQRGGFPGDFPQGVDLRHGGRGLDGTPRLR